MLTQIHISNLATIQTVSLELTTGTTVITGETGAGKSIVIDAIEFALGKRATTDIIRAHQEKADVSICFDIRYLPEVDVWLKQHDVDSEAKECIIRRTITRDGRSRSYLNQMPITLQVLKELSELLIDIHGQHEHQSLLRPEKQRELLDHYAGHYPLVTEVQKLATEWHAVTQEYKQLQTLSSEHTARAEFLKFQLQELEELNINPDEFQQLDIEHKQLANADELLNQLNFSIHTLADNEENNILSLLNRLTHALESIRDVDSKVIPWLEVIKNTHIQLGDVEDELRRYLESTHLNPERLQWVEQRISKIFDTARKHKVAPAELFEFQQKLATELHSLENSDECLAQLSQQLQEIKKDYQNVAKKLSLSRKTFAMKLENEISHTIRKLSLPNGTFHVAFNDTENELSPHGLEKITFEITTNLGQPLQPLAKIASGGELSRISLAIDIATAEQHTIPTLIFDEVDVGISGATAEIVGKLLNRLGKTHQVLCVTHLPQVAAQGHQHLRVEKTDDKKATHTHIRLLDGEERIAELARMLGGVKITKTTLEHAKEMIGNSPAYFEQN